MKDRPSRRGARPRRRRLGVALGLAFVAVAAARANADATEPRAPAAAPAKTSSAQGGPSPRTDAPPAGEAQKRARRLFQDAEAHFHAGLFAEALGEYQAGYDAAALPGFLINIAQCERRLGNLTGALTTYRKFIMVAPDSPYVPQVRALMADLETLARDAGRERERAASARPGARAADAGSGRSSGSRETKGTLPLEAGASALAAKPPAEAQTPALIDRPGAAAPEAPAGTEPAARASSTRWWWIGGAAALVAVAGGTVAVFALRPGDPTTLHEGSLGTLRR